MTSLEAISRLVDCSKEPYLAKGRSYIYSPDRRAIAAMEMPPTTESQTPKGCILSSILSARVPDQVLE